MKADEALALGLVDRVVPAGGAVDAALEWATSLGTGAVVAMGIAKRVIDTGFDLPLADALDLEAAGFAEVFETEDATTGIRASSTTAPAKPSSPAANHQPASAADV